MKTAEEKLEPEITHFLETYKDDIESGNLKNQLVNGAEVGTEGLTLPKKEAIEGDTKVRNTSKKVEASAIDPLEYYNMVKAHTASKKAKKQKLDEEEEEEVEDVEEEEGGKRMITYEMSKNKGLIRNRRKELKNPRVKHKMKFKKAIVKRKSVVREVRNESNRYGGETTGITKSLSRSTKIK